MNGSDILIARKRARLSQSQLARALQLQGGRGTLTDVENGNIEISPSWGMLVIAKIQELHERAACGTGADPRQATS